TTMKFKLASDPRRGEWGTVEARRRKRWRRRPTLLALEDRRLLGTFTVDSTNPSCPGSLAAEIALANAPGPNTVNFSSLFNTPQTITLAGTQLELSSPSGTETITGPAAGVTVSGGGASRVFQVDANVTASISRL